MKFIRQLFAGKENELALGPLLLLGNIGLLCLLLGMVCTLLKYAYEMWPIIAMAFSGFLFTWRWKKSGFLFSLVLLACIALSTSQATSQLWPALLSTSVALSWLLVLLGLQEGRALLKNYERDWLILKADNELLNTQLQAAPEEVSLLALKTELASLQSKLEIEEKDKQNLKQKVEHLLLEISSYQRKEKAFQHALEDAQSQLLKAKYTQVPTPNIIPQEEEDSKDLSALEGQLAQLREQFDEKSEVLHETRKQLFAMESQYLTFQKEVEESAYIVPSEEAHLMEQVQHLTQEAQELEFQVQALQELISSLLITKKAAPVRRRKLKAEKQDDLFAINSVSQI